MVVFVLVCRWWSGCQNEEEGGCNGLESTREIIEDYDIRAQNESRRGAREQWFAMIESDEKYPKDLIREVKGCE